MDTGASGRAGDEPEGLLQDGERRLDEVSIRDAQVTVTDRRLIAITPGRDPPRRAIDRANVTAIGVRTRRTGGSLWVAGQWALLGILLVAVPRFIAFEGLVRPVEPRPGSSLSGIFELANAITGAFALLDEAFLVVGALALAWAAWRLVGYLRARERNLEVTVAGGEPLFLPVPATDEPVERLRTLCELTE